MAGYKVIDMETWPRRTHWVYYRNLVKAATSLTKRVDVTALVDYCHKNNKKFSAVFLHTVSKTVNSLEFMRMFALEDGNPAVWDVVHPNYTIFHKDDETFSDVWMEYDPDENTFLKTFDTVLAEYGDKKGIKVRDDQPANFFCLSGVPWIDYDAATTYSAGDRPPMLFPILNYGKYTERDGRLEMPFTVTISHAAMDGYHQAKFFEKLQENLDKVGQGQ